MNFAENLRTLRKKKNYSQEELADKLQVSRQAISKWESGTGFPEIENLMILCELFDCSMDELIKGKISLDASLEKQVYEHFIDQFSQSIAGAIMLILIGVVGMLIVIGLDEANTLLGVVILLIFVVFAVPIFVSKGLAMEHFKNKYPNLPYFYSHDDIDKAQQQFSKSITVAISLILVGVVIFMASQALDLFNGNTMFSLVCLMIFVTISVPILIHAGIEKYNHENTIEFRNKSAEVGKYCGLIMIVTAMIYLSISFIFNLWHISWIVFPIGGMLCGIVSILKQN